MDIGKSAWKKHLRKLTIKRKVANKAARKMRRTQRGK